MATIEQRAEQIYRGNTIEEEAYKNGATDQRAIDEAELKPHWIPCSERMPNEDGWYLVSINNSVSILRYYAEENEWMYLTNSTKVTHWMPLPPAPSK